MQVQSKPIPMWFWFFELSDSDSRPGLSSCVWLYNKEQHLGLTSFPLLASNALKVSCFACSYIIIMFLLCFIVCVVWYWHARMHLRQPLFVLITLCAGVCVYCLFKLGRPCNWYEGYTHSCSQRSTIHIFWHTHLYTSAIVLNLSCLVCLNNLIDLISPLIVSYLFKCKVCARYCWY